MKNSPNSKREVNGEVRGVLNVDSDRHDAFSAEDQELLVSQAINSTFALDDALKVITREAATLMQAKMCSLMMLDKTRQWLDLRASYGAGRAYLNKPRLSVEESVLGIVVRRKKPLQVENVQVSSRYQSVEEARREGRVALLSVPLLFSG